MSLVIRAFGTMEIEVNGQPAERTRTRTELWLLAWLILHHEREADRNWLASLFWPDSPEQGALHNLRRSLTNLRAVLGPEAKRILSPTPRTLRLDAAGADIDVVNFDAAIKRGEGAALLTAIELYRGPLLEGCRNEWILPEREIRQQAYLDALETLAREAEAQTRYGEAARYLYQLLTLDPVRESAVCALMQTLAAQGDTAAITQVYRNFRLYLHQQLNAAPAEQTAALYRQLRHPTQGKSEEGRREGEEKRRREEERRETSALSAQNAERTTQNATPQHAAPCAPPRRLPVPLTPLIGREKEIEEVSAFLQANRLVTLAGTGGVGKTRLAIAVAENAFSRFRDGIWFVDLAALTDPALVPRAIASTLGVREETEGSLEQTLIAFLQPKSALLILDNCEHLIDSAAHCANLLLRRCPDIRLIATSREALQVSGEQVVRVPSLSFPPDAALARDEKNLPAILMDYDSVRLFVASASSIRATFRLNPKNAKVVASLCRRLDGIPLALELAAARISSLPVEEINTRLSERFHLLTKGRRAVLPRHQTLRALIDWSVDILTEPEKALLFRLAVFAGGWTLEAAESVCATNDEERTVNDQLPTEESSWPMSEQENSDLSVVRPSSFVLRPAEVWELLLALVDKSLVIFEEQEDGTGRYRLLETIRQYGQERLEELGELAAWRGRHRDYFLTLAEKAEPQLSGQEQAAWMERVETEHDNLRAAIGWCLTEPEETEKGLRLTGALYLFWDIRGHFGEGREWFMAMLARPGAQGRTRARARALTGAGLLARRQNEYALARSLHEESLAISRELGERLEIARGLGNLGLVAWDQDDFTTANSLYGEALEIFREIGDSRRVAAVLHALALVAAEQSDYARARALYEEVLPIYREHGNKRHIATILHSLGFMLREKHDYARARELSEESLAMCRELGDKQGIASSLTNLGEMAREEGDYARAHALYEESLTINRGMGERTGIGLSIANLGLVACEQGDYAKARALGEESLALFRELGNRRCIAAVLNDLGKVAVCQRDYLSARERYGEALTIVRDVADRQGIAVALDSFAGLAFAQGHFESAARLWSAAESLRQTIGASLSPREQEQNREDRNSARAALGEAAFAAAWTEGLAMTPEQAIASALAE